MSEKIEENKIEENYHQSKLMSFIMNDPTATVQTLIDGDKQGETVREGEYSIEYEIFTTR